jgi:hypothetical protein
VSTAFDDIFVLCAEQEIEELYQKATDHNGEKKNRQKPSVNLC